MEVRFDEKLSEKKLFLVKIRFTFLNVERKLV